MLEKLELYAVVTNHLPTGIRHACDITRTTKEAAERLAHEHIVSLERTMPADLLPNYEVSVALFREV